MIICRAKQPVEEVAAAAEQSETEKFSKSLLVMEDVSGASRKPFSPRGITPDYTTFTANKKLRRWHATTTTTTTSIIHRSAEEEFLIQFVKERKDGRRRQAELCVRQWKHEDD